MTPTSHVSVIDSNSFFFCDFLARGDNCDSSNSMSTSKIGTVVSELASSHGCDQPSGNWTLTWQYKTSQDMNLLIM